MASLPWPPYHGLPTMASLQWPPYNGPCLTHSYILQYLHINLSKDRIPLIEHAISMQY